MTKLFLKAGLWLINRQLRVTEVDDAETLKFCFVKQDEFKQKLAKVEGVKLND